MVSALFDTNILLDHIRGVDAARLEFSRYDDRAISIVTFMEVLVGTTPASEAAERAFLASFTTVALDGAVAEEAVRLRRAHRMRLPDAVIWASARLTGRLLVTRNTKDFPPADPGVRAPYRI
jgi:predicted nucleic acid-binding protein